MLDPLRLSMKRYTDTVESNLNKSLQSINDQNGNDHNRIDTDVEQLKNENKKLKVKIHQMQNQIDSMAQSISQLQGQVFGNYDSETEIAQTTK